MNRSLDESAHGNLKYFSDHRCLSRSEESKSMWSRKVSLIAAIFQVSVCTFIRRSLFIGEFSLFLKLVLLSNAGRGLQMFIMPIDQFLVNSIYTLTRCSMHQNMRDTNLLITAKEPKYRCHQNNFHLWSVGMLEGKSATPTWLMSVDISIA